MTPPPLDPILPVGHGDGIRVARNGAVDRVTRRFAREDEDDGGGSRRHHEHHEQPRDHTWGSSALDPAAEAGAYDDHGRTGLPGPTAATQRHVDLSA
ncbi:MAG: hypothetical protein JWM98_2026 [Thermoleophilia bacterium]|nr:hypothetical protein [Thermoleophilia bacterium]